MPQVVSHLSHAALHGTVVVLEVETIKWLNRVLLVIYTIEAPTPEDQVLLVSSQLMVSYHRFKEPSFNARLSNHIATS